MLVRLYRYPFLDTRTDTARIDGVETRVQMRQHTMQPAAAVLREAKLQPANAAACAPSRCQYPHLVLHLSRHRAHQGERLRPILRVGIGIALQRSSRACRVLGELK